MKHFGSFLAASALAITALPVLAQESSGPGGPPPMYWYGHMWGGYGGWHHGLIFGPFVMVLALIGLVALIVLLVRVFSHGGYAHWHGHGMCSHRSHGQERTALDILEERLAKGEIGKDEFEEKRKLLGR